MDRVVLPNGRATSRIGFGCGSLRGGSDAAASRALVVAALDAGVRHFDLAPSYGLGLAEDVAGSVLAPLHREVTITTKAGIGRPAASGLLTGIRGIAKPVLGRFPALWGLAANKVRTVASNRGCFDPEFVRGSVLDSLQRLGVGSVDILLMHEMRDGDVTAELLTLLGEFSARGVVGALGTGGGREEGQRIAARHAELRHVRQFRWNVFDPAFESVPGTLCITHGAIGSVLGRVTSLLASRPEAAMVWSARLDADLADPGEICDLLLAAALAKNADGIVLAASENSLHVRRAAEVAADPVLIEKGGLFHSLLRDGASSEAGAATSVTGTLLDGRGGS